MKKNILILLLGTVYSFGAVNPQIRIREMRPDNENGVFWAKIENVTIGTIITIWGTNDPSKIGVMSVENMDYSFYGYEETVTAVFSMKKKYWWASQTPYYPSPQ